MSFFGAVDDFFKGADPTKVGKANTAGVDQEKMRFMDAYNQSQNRQASQVDPNAVFGQTQQGRNQQMNSVGMLQSAAEGNAPSAAQVQLNRGTEQALQAQVAAAVSQRGGFNPGALRNAQSLGAQTMQDANSQAAMLRAQEIAQARGQYADATNALRGQDLGASQLAQQAALGNAQMQMQNADMADEMTRAFMNAGMSAEQAKFMSEQQRQNQIGDSRGKMFGGVTSALGGLGAAALMASDERLKENVDDAGKDMNEFLNAITDKSWDYKDQKFGQGRKYGIMAQDAEKTNVGKSFVIDTPEGKMLDMRSGFSAFLASVAHLNKRMNSVEKK